MRKNPASMTVPAPTSLVHQRVEDEGQTRRRLRGRAQEQRRALRMLEQARSGRGGVMLVEGERGMGRSSLLAEVAALAAERGFGVLTGRAEDDARLTPLAPLVRALGEPARALVESDGGPVEGVDARERLVDQLWLVDQLRLVLGDRARQGPLLMALDDLQWADPATLLGLRTIPARMASLPMVWVLARRSGEGGQALDRISSMLEDDGSVRVELGPLAGEAVADILTDTFGTTPEPELLALAEAAGGNPRLVVELAEGLRDEAAVEVKGGSARLRSSRLPDRARALALEPLGGLSAEARHLLDVASLLGPSFSVDDLADLLGEPAGHLLYALRAALDAGVLVPRGQNLVFRCSLCRRALAEAIPEAVRRALDHQLRALKKGRGTAMIVRRAAPLAIRAAAPPVAAKRSSPALSAVEATTAAGRLEGAAALARSALAQQPPKPEAAELRSALASILLLSGQTSTALTAAEAVLAEPDLQPEVATGAEMARLWALAARGELALAGERAEKILWAADRHGDAAFAAAQIVLSLVAWEDGRLADGFKLVSDALGRASRRPAAARRPGVGHVGCRMAVMLGAVGHLEEADAALRAADEEIAVLADPLQAAAAAGVRARIELDAGRLDPAVTSAEAALRSAGELGAHLFAPAPLSVLAAAALQRDDLRTAVEHVERYRADLAGDPATFGPARYAWLEAQLAYAEHGPGRALQALAGLLDRLPGHPGLLGDHPAAAAWMVRTALAAGDHRRAGTVMAAAERLGAANPAFPGIVAAAGHARALLDRDPAALLRVAGAHRHPWARASAAEDAGVLLADAGDSGAVAPFDQSLATYQDAGAYRDAARVRSRLRRLGVRRRHWRHTDRPVCGWAALTDTEHRVAATVAEGLTNRQVAERMFLSPHTVDFHLRQIFRKLDIRSRVELTRLLLECDERDHRVQPAGAVG